MKSTLLLTTLACTALACAAPDEVSAPNQPMLDPEAQIDPDPATNPAWHHDIANDGLPLAAEVDFPRAEIPEAEQPPPNDSTTCRTAVDTELFADADMHGPYVEWRYDDDCMQEAMRAYLWIAPPVDTDEVPFGDVEGVLYSADIDGETAFSLRGEYTLDLASDTLSLRVEIYDGGDEPVGDFRGVATTDTGVPMWIDGYVNYR